MRETREAAAQNQQVEMPAATSPQEATTDGNVPEEGLAEIGPAPTPPETDPETTTQRDPFLNGDSTLVDKPASRANPREFESEVSEAEDEMEEALFLISEGAPTEEASAAEEEKPGGGLFEEPQPASSEYEIPDGAETISKPARSPFLRDHSGDSAPLQVEPPEPIENVQADLPPEPDPDLKNNPFQIAPPPAEEPTLVPDSLDIPSSPPTPEADPLTSIPGLPTEPATLGGNHASPLPPPGSSLPQSPLPAASPTDIAGPPAGFQPSDTSQLPPAQPTLPPTLFGQDQPPATEEKPPLAQLPGIAPATGLPPAPENKKTVLPPPRTQLPPPEEPAAPAPEQPSTLPPATDSLPSGLPGLPQSESVTPPPPADSVFGTLPPPAENAVPPTPIEPTLPPQPPSGPAPLAEMVPAPRPGLTPAEIAAKDRADKLAKKKSSDSNLPPKRKIEAQDMPAPETKGKKGKAKQKGAAKPEKQKQPKQRSGKKKLMLIGAPIALVLAAAATFGFLNKEKLGFGADDQVVASKPEVPIKKLDPIEAEPVIGSQGTSFSPVPIPIQSVSDGGGAKPGELDEPPPALQITEEERLAIIKDPRRTLDAFLLSGNIEELLMFVADREIVEPEIRAHYKGGSRTPIAHRSIDEDKSGIVPGTNKRAYMFWVTTSRRKIPVSVEETDEGYKVDWAAFTQFHDGTFENFIRKPNSPAGGYYVELRRSHIFGNSVPDQDELHVFRVRSPIAPYPEAYAFLRRDNPEAQSILERYPWGKEGRPFIELKWVKPGGGAEQRIEIERIARHAWRR